MSGGWVLGLGRMEASGPPAPQCCCQHLNRAPRVLKAQEQAVPLSCKISRCGRRLAWMNRELFLRLQEKKRVYLLWKKGWATQTEYKEVAETCR